MTLADSSSRLCIALLATLRGADKGAAVAPATHTFEGRGHHLRALAGLQSELTEC